MPGVQNEQWSPHLIGLAFPPPSTSFLVVFRPRTSIPFLSLLNFSLEQVARLGETTPPPGNAVDTNFTVSGLTFKPRQGTSSSAQESCLYPFGIRGRSAS